MVVIISLGGFVADKMRYNLESAQFVIEQLYNNKWIYISIHAI